MLKGKRFTCTVKTIICNLYDYFKNVSNKNNRISIPKLGKKNSKAIGYCKCTVKRVVAEKIKLEGAL